MPSSVTPMIITHDLERLARFYTGLTGATEDSRTPAEGPTFYLGLRIGDSELGIVSDGSVAGAPAGRVVLSIEVPDVDAALTRAESLGGKRVSDPDEVPGTGIVIAHLSDPEGHVIGLVNATS